MIQFKVGLYNLNDNANYNFQLSRLSIISTIATG